MTDTWEVRHDDHIWSEERGHYVATASDEETAKKIVTDHNLMARARPLWLEYSFGAHFVWLVWAIKPGVAHLAAVCTTEEKADKYMTTLPTGGGLSYRGCTMWKEKRPLDHAFGWRDSVAAMVTKGGAA